MASWGKQHQAPEQGWVFQRCAGGLVHERPPICPAHLQPSHTTGKPQGTWSNPQMTSKQIFAFLPESKSQEILLLHYLFRLILVQRHFSDNIHEILNCGTNRIRWISLILHLSKFLGWETMGLGGGGAAGRRRVGKGKREKPHSLSLQDLPSGHEQSIILTFLWFSLSLSGSKTN